MSDGMSQVHMDLYTPAASSMAFHATIACSKGLFRLVLHTVNVTGSYKPPALEPYVRPTGRAITVHRMSMMTSTHTRPSTCNAT